MGRYLIIFVGILLSGCKKDDPIYNPTPYEADIPEGFPTMIIPESNPMTEQGVFLGRKLYYDNLLHPNQSFSCASCHNQTLAFTTYSSNALPHINLAWASSFLWKGKVEGTLEDIMLFEVDDFFKTDLDLLRNDEYYPDLFFEAFGSTEITSAKVAMALAQFFRTLISGNSRYDKFLKGGGDFTPEEIDGYDIFFTERGDCFHCHGGILMTDNQFHNNGLDANPSLGRYEITGYNGDIGKFKTPTLRNIEFTAPYMHDGRYETLEEVVSFYCFGLQNSPTIDPLMKNVGSGGIMLTPEDQQHLIAFLKTLSDPDFLNNPELGQP